MNTIIDAYTDLTKKFMNGDSQITLAQLKAIFISMNPAFITDKMFNDMIPSIHGIVSCEIEIEKQKAEGRKPADDNLSQTEGKEPIDDDLSREEVTILGGFKDLTERFLTEDPKLNLEQLKCKFTTASPGFKSCVVFAKYIPIVHNYIICKINDKDAFNITNCVIRQIIKTNPEMSLEQLICYFEEHPRTANITNTINRALPAIYHMIESERAMPY